MFKPALPLRPIDRWLVSNLLISPSCAVRLGNRKGTQGISLHCARLRPAYLRDLAKRTIVADSGSPFIFPPVKLVDLVNETVSHS